MKKQWKSNVLRNSRRSKTENACAKPGTSKTNEGKLWSKSVKPGGVRIKRSKRLFRDSERLKRRNARESWQLKKSKRDSNS